MRKVYLGNTQIAEIPAGANNGGAIEGGYLVRFLVNGEPYCNISVLAGDAVQEPSEPEDVVFGGWYTAETGGQEITFPFTPTGNTTIYAHVEERHIVGIQGFGTSLPSVTLFGDIVDVPMWTTETDGNYVSVINPLDNYWPFNQIEEFTDSEGNKFVKFPKMWMRWLEGSTTEHWIEGVRFANYKVDDNYFISDAFLDPKNTTGNTYLDYFALGKYEASGSSSKAYSKSGVSCLVNITRPNFRIGCRAYGTASNYYNGYQSMDIQQLVIYNMLCMMYYRTKNIKTVFEGRTGVSHTWDSTAITGTTDGVVGLNGWNTSTYCVKMLGIENPYGNINKFFDGITFNYGSVYVDRYPQNYSDTINKPSIGFKLPSTKSNFVMRLRAGTSGETISAVMPSATYPFDDGWEEYYGDYYFIYTNDSIIYTAMVGGSYSNSMGGLWAFNNHTLSQYEVTPRIGGRLAYRPVNE